MMLIGFVLSVVLFLLHIYVLHLPMQKRLASWQQINADFVSLRGVCQQRAWTPQTEPDEVRALERSITKHFGTLEWW